MVRLDAVAGLARPLVLLAMTAVVLPPGGQAQTPTWELGMDGAVSFTTREAVDGVESSSVQAWAFPLQRFRAGRWVGGRLQAQFSSAFSVADFGDASTVRFALGASGLYHLTGDGIRSGAFVSLGAGLDFVSHHGSDVQWTGVGGVGVKVPWGGRFAFRPALEVARSPRSTRRLAATTVSVVLGASVLTGSDSDR